jgi:hypothetical protein
VGGTETVHRHGGGRDDGTGREPVVDVCGHDGVVGGI